jgi:hypothetical protein
MRKRCVEIATIFVVVGGVNGPAPGVKVVMTIFDLPWSLRQVPYGPYGPLGRPKVASGSEYGGYGLIVLRT